MDREKTLMERGEGAHGQGREGTSRPREGSWLEAWPPDHEPSSPADETRVAADEPGMVYRSWRRVIASTGWR
jgi:hypothetical protein